ncbi:MAG: EamA family transporter [Halobacteriovoraceae bacterium]|nr:EamA family transporter [Halobacteriovoraceae bacterium]|tara:strand:+ start:5753 stop:6592 length:840 start_codon:yes stop_codon:yes gene_type:complete
MTLNKGIINILIASFFFSIVNALVKYLDRIPAIEIIFFRSLVSFVICYSIVLKKNIKIFNKHTPTLFARGLFGAIALSLYFYTIQQMPLATAVTILYLAPIFTVFFAIFIVGEFPNKLQIPFFILCFIGAALLKNFDPRVELFDFLCGIFAAMFAGLAYNMIRLLRGKADSTLIILYFPMVTIPFCIPWLLKLWVTPNWQELILLLSIGGFTQLAQVFMTNAYLYEKASVVSQYNYMTCLFAFLTGIIFFNEHLSLLSLLGLFLIFVGIVFSSKFAPRS